MAKRKTKTEAARRTRLKALMNKAFFRFISRSGYIDPRPYESFVAGFRTARRLLRSKRK